MINKRTKFIVDKASWKKVLLLLIPTLGTYFTMLFYSIPKVMEYTNGMKILDLIPMGYNSEYAQKLFETLGKTGRNIYLWEQIPLDMIYPILFAITFSLFLALVLKKAFSQEKNLQKLCILPAIAGLFDYLENIGIIIMIQIFPTFNNGIANITNIFSVSKSLTTTISFTLIIIGLITLFLKKKGVFKNEILQQNNKE